MKTLIAKEDTPLEAAIRERDEDVLIIRDGHVVALVTPFDDDDAEWYARERDPAFIASIAEARKQAQDGKTISHDELKAKLGIK